MRLEQLSVDLRPRTAWEASDLGVALVRRHWWVIAQAWVAVTLPALVLFTICGYLLGQIWLGALLLWWLKPWFDRVPLFVLSRAVFGQTPSVRETLGIRGALLGSGVWPWLSWRRLHPARSLLLPIDLLEGQRGAGRATRARILMHGVGNPGFMLSVIGWHLEAMLVLSVLVLALMFVPVEFLSESAQAMWATLFQDRPDWAQALWVVIYWLAMAVIEPIYVGAGFGLYLNRRIQLEAWDIELAFRRLAERLRGLAAALALALLGGTLLTGLPAAASDAPVEEAAAVDQTQPRPLTLEQIFSRQYRHDGVAWEADVAQAYRDPDLRPRKRISEWKLRNPPEPGAERAMPLWLRSLGSVVALLSKYGLWLLFVMLLVLVLVRHRQWLPWVADALRPAVSNEAIASTLLTAAQVPPTDLPAAVRVLWQSDPRAAMALFYRGAVARLVEHLGVPLAPGSTEADCLRASRRLGGQAYAALFARIVRHWQATAYAARQPDHGELEALLAAWSEGQTAGQEGAEARV